MAAAKARPIPVLPLVGSIRVSPGLIRPAFSASSIIRFPILNASKKSEDEEEDEEEE